MSNNDQTYNGWTNRETWALVLHLDNEQSTYEYAREQATAAYDDALTEAGQDYPEWPEDQRAALARSKTADAMRELAEALYTRDGYVDATGGSWPDDLADAASDIGSLWRIDWLEVAAHFIAE